MSVPTGRVKQETETAYFTRSLEIAAPLAQTLQIIFVVAAVVRKHTNAVVVSGALDDLVM